VVRAGAKREPDTRLGRQVAVKVLPAAFAADPERLYPFEKEARAPIWTIGADLLE
jgi:hypothetical protein